MRALIYIAYLVFVFLLIQFGLTIILSAIDTLPEGKSNVAWYGSLITMIFIPNLVLVKLVLKLKWLRTFLTAAVVTALSFAVPYLLIRIFWIKSEFQLPFGVLVIVLCSAVLIELLKIQQNLTDK